MYRHLFVDVGNAFPTLRDELEIDFRRLSTLFADRGLHLFCVDFPFVGKHLDRCVSEGKFLVSGLPLTKRCPRCIMYPEFLRGLWGLIFQENGTLKEDCDVEAYLLLRQIYFMAKKLKLDCPSEAVLSEVQEFIETDGCLPDPEEVWYTTAAISEAYEGFAKSTRYQARIAGHPLSGELSSFLSNLDIVSGFLGTALGDYSPKDWSFRHGPGVVSERKGAVNKYEFVNWSEALEQVYPYADCAFYSYDSWIRSVRFMSISGINPTSRLIAVPKTLSSPRLIAAEPTEHMWCQQNIWHYFRERVSRTWISSFLRFTDQTRNQELCRSGSLTGALATLDLSSASDRVTCHFVGNLFRSNPRLLEALRATRTRTVSQDLAPCHPPEIRLKKFSTMGSACTFPVESIGFLAVALAACLTRRGLQVTLRNLVTLKEEVTIFGDDIIVPTDCRELVCEALEVLDFKVNTSKSFWNGNFRESCGVDAYSGIDITPVYWRAFQKSDPDAVVGAVEVRNSFYQRGLWAVAEYLTSTIPRRNMPVVRTTSGVFGLATFGPARISGLYRRYNVFYQRDEVLCLGYTTKQRIREITDDTVLLQFFTENPQPHEPWAGGVALRAKGRLRLGWASTSDVVS